MHEFIFEAAYINSLLLACGGKISAFFCVFDTFKVVPRYHLSFMQIQNQKIRKANIPENWSAVLMCVLTSAAHTRREPFSPVSASSFGVRPASALRWLLIPFGLRPLENLVKGWCTLENTWCGCG